MLLTLILEMDGIKVCGQKMTNEDQALQIS